MQTVHNSYHDATRLQDYIHLTEGPKCVDSTYIKQKQNQAPIGLAEREHLVASLLSGDRKLWTETVGNDFRWASSQDDPLSAAKYITIDWIVLIKLAIKQNVNSNKTRVFLRQNIEICMQIVNLDEFLSVITVIVNQFRENMF